MSFRISSHKNVPLNVPSNDLFSLDGDSPTSVGPADGLRASHPPRFDGDFDGDFDSDFDSGGYQRTMAVEMLPDLNRTPWIDAKTIWFVPESGSPLLISCYFESKSQCREISPDRLPLISLANGQRTAAQIAREAKLPIGLAMEQYNDWHLEVPAMIRWTEPSTDSAPDLLHRAAMSLFNQFQAANTPQTDNERYHQNEITDGMHQFDDVEITVSHIYRQPHPALGGRTYGGGFCDGLLAAGHLKPNAKVLEIGGGTGWFARCLLDRLQNVAPEIYNTLSYTIADLSPALSDSQRQRNGPHLDRMTFAPFNAETDTPPNPPYDLILSNEVIADFSVGWLDADGTASDPETQRLAETHALHTDFSMGPCVLNRGALRFVERIPAWLAPGGSAVLTEYGSEREIVAEVRLDGHKEYSICFGNLRLVAEAAGLETELRPIAKLVGLDLDHPLLSFASYSLAGQTLRKFLGLEPLPVLAWSKASLLAEANFNGEVGNLQEGTAAVGGIMNAGVFHALILRKP